MKKGTADLRNAVKAAEQNALEVLVDLFDWLDSVESQPTAEVVGNSQRMQTDARPSMHRTEPRNTIVSHLPANLGARNLSLWERDVNQRPHLPLTGRLQRRTTSTRAR